MPGLEIHTYVDKLFFGRSYWRIHREMDRPYKYLGKYHRVLFHDPLLAYVIARKQYPNDPNAIAAAQCHIAIDNLCTRNPEFKRALARLAKLDRKKKKSAKSTSTSPSAGGTDASFARFCELIDLLNSPAARSADTVLADLVGKSLAKLRGYT